MRGSLGLLFIAGLSLHATAQDPARPARTLYVLSALVTDPEGVAIENADILVTQDSASPRSFRTDTAGRFRVADLVSRRVTVRIRRLGYEARIIPVMIPAASGQTALVVALQPTVAKLKGMSVTEIEDEPDARLREFYSRQATNSFGHYVERETIAKKRPQWVSDVLRPLPGVTIQSSRRLGNTVKLRGCQPLLWVDRVRLPGAELDEVVQPEDVAAIEVYNSFAGIPAQYFDRTATCGTILVWTRSR